MLTFEVIQQNNNQEVKVYCDESGFNLLVKALHEAQKQGHVHLLSPSSGGNELESITIFGTKAVDEVIITVTPD